jgi:crotonobetainyl-CoA:carnitine CoA-transferase CaiB-like acyl-CoA transferase
MSKKALSGLKVVEYGSFISAPYCTKLMADMGAEVIKVELPGTGDESRNHGPFPDDVPYPEKSGLFLYRP